MRKTRKAVKEKDKVSGSKSVVEHLEELRKRIIISVVSFFGLFMVIISVPGFTDSFGLRIMKLLQEYILNNIRGGAALNLVFLDPLEPVFTVLKLSSLVTLVVLAPLFLYQAYAYLKPAFTGKTGKHLGAFILGSEILFLLGAVFSLYFLIPASFNILIRFGLSTGAGPVLSMGKFFDMFFWMFLLFTLPFELPVLIGVLSKTGIVTVRMLGKIRKPAYLGLAIFCAAVTPDPTPFSMLILWGLLLILFEFGVFLSHIFEKGESKWV
ncbi:MAG: twin arginine-targeting protein translocase TatC [Candidatus Firestonebacteria bacterium RIFOXYC2_FULL_39_67]|nr:MAG: twin arginine-targeting protein translocase TatC [Candidatus Firestonebacteria bacterium RIFOXYD2_FULL_39_29]OGF56575.1 MAG: twin arginine-targeting protein translocase TatC [Candidatus Firestonebacteria bacterium RIFOXYC2_FULL_39_67]OGF58062.1 MAG: twin arginine-targeting protein translocase TatC [Candidatus Firestonebacteria bacterium RifOxyC12_full_39_7]